MIAGIDVNIRYVTIPGDYAVYMYRDDVVAMLDALAKVTMEPKPREEILKLALHIAKWRKP